MSFRAGDILRLAPKGKQPRIRGWLLGTVDGSSEGVVPANYVKVRDSCSLWYSYLSRAIARMKQTKTLASVNGFSPVSVASFLKGGINTLLNT